MTSRRMNVSRCGAGPFGRGRRVGRGLLVWVPRLVAGSLTPFQRVEVVTTVALTAAGWVVADSFAPAWKAKQ
ncbi:MAG TPA: hypothetical protein VIJ36_21050 [Thermoanaerobaculia bacterium]